MGDLKMLTLPLVMLLLLPSQSNGVDVYRACLMECFNCVQTYGKDFYNGKQCAENCDNTFGQSIDTKCFPPDKRAAKPPTLTFSCKKRCKSICGYDSIQVQSAGHFCMLSCILSNKKYTTC